MSKVRERFASAGRGAFTDVPENDWQDWRWQQRSRVRDAESISALVQLTSREREAISASRAHFEMAVTPYYTALIDPLDPKCPVRMQSIPVPEEMDTATDEMEDPLAEERYMPVPGITHRYPDRVLFYTTHNCPVYCRHCTRKRKVSDAESAPNMATLDAGIAYIRAHPEVRDVIVSGGDPLTFSDDRLSDLLLRLRDIPHVDIIRIGTRNLVTLPQRVTLELAAVLKQVGPIYIQTHFNHPKECTREAFDACVRLAEAGCVLSNQMVLMRGINDDVETVRELNKRLLMMRVRPYYILQADPAFGTRHFRTSIETGIALIEGLRGHVSGLAVPHYVVDLPGGGGKVSLVPRYEVARVGKRYTFRNYRGDHYEYWDP
jgi:lysine 2,3-aminomutase